MSASRTSPPSGRLSRLAAIVSLVVAPVVPALLGGCSHATSGAGTQRVEGQTDFLSAPLPSYATASFGAAGGTANGAAAPTAPGNSSSGSSSSGGGTASTGAPRTVQETDIYRVSGNTLYYLNTYRGLMVFDVTNVDQPKLLGRAPIFGDPQEMLLSGNLAVVVVGDWYGVGDDGAPFHGSIARGFDCTDPTNIKVVGDAKLGGYVQDTRVVGSVLYTVAQDYGWEYGWGYGWGGFDGPVGGGVAYGDDVYGTAQRVIVASVSFANGAVTKVAEQPFDGADGVFYVTPNAIMLAHQDSASVNETGPATTDLQYVDISDPGGAIAVRGGITVSGAVSGWGPDNGRWNLDFQDNVHAHVLGCGQSYCGDPSDSYVLSTVDFTNPDAPVLDSELNIANLGWSAAARFDVGRMYLSPSTYYASNATTPMYVYDLSSPSAPALAGQANLTGNIWMFIPNDGTNNTTTNTVFALGDTYSASTNGSSDQVQVQYVDVTDATKPVVVNSTSFGAGWSWSPVADTFKAFTVDDTQGLAVVPFSGWDPNGYTYTNGCQLLQFSPTALTSAGAAHTKGWVERGIFVNNRLISLSDLSLGVVDYSNPANPIVVTELTLARNVVNAQPQGSTIAELSSDWWGNDTTTSEMRVLPIANAAETSDDGTGVSVNIPGVNASVFSNGTLNYVVTTTTQQAACPPSEYGPTGTCTVYSEQVQVVDTSNGGATLRGTITLPNLPYLDGGLGWDGFWYYDWYDGSPAVQVGTDALAFRRWYPQWSTDANGDVTYQDSLDALYVVDLSNPDAPAIASLTITADPSAWWGDMMAVGDTLYTTHFEWESKPSPNDPSGTVYYVRYYLDQIDLSDRAHPRVGQKINAPGVLVGASSEDPSLLYFADYRWDSQNERSDLAVAKISGGKAYLQSVTSIDGWVGNIIVQNDHAYMTAQEYDWAVPSGATAFTELHQVDLTNPQKPVDRIATDPNNPFGWLLAVDGDRAVVTSGWGPVGIDIYLLSDTAAPQYSQSALSLGWGPNAVSRQGNTLYLTSGYWGVQPIALQ